MTQKLKRIYNLNLRKPESYFIKSLCNGDVDGIL